jgi:signal transduction histidine kinase/ActR/RegA family two-component response regulator
MSEQSAVETDAVAPSSAADRAGASLTFNSIFLACVVIDLVGAIVLFAFPSLQNQTVHTILDTAIVLSTGILALLFWQVSARTKQPIAQFMAISLTLVMLGEMVHEAAVIARPLNGANGILGMLHDLSGTWGPSAGLLPLSLLIVPLVEKSSVQMRRILVALMVVLDGALFLLFTWLPHLDHPVLLGIDRPSLALIPLLWLVVGVFYWRSRGVNAMARAVALMAALSIPTSLAIIYSHTPFDAPELVAHFEKIVARLFLLMASMQVGAANTDLLVRAERDLRAFNLGLEQRIRERTTELEQANESLTQEGSRRSQAEARLQTQVDRLNLLNQITRAIGDRIDLGSIYQVVVRSLEDRLPVDLACVLLTGTERQTLTVTNVGVRGKPIADSLGMSELARVTVDGSGLSRCIEGELVYEPDISVVPFPFAQRLTGEGLRSLIISPITGDKRPVGILLLARRTPSDFSSSDCEFITQLSAHVSLAVHQAQLYQTLQQAYDDLRLTQQASVQQERLRAIGQMASGIAHDINNAISPVALYTKSLLEKETQLSPNIRSYLETVRRVIDDVASTVSRMREFYRPAEAHASLDSVALNELVEQVLELTRARWSDMAQQRGVVIEIRTELASGLPQISGVASELREALTNLVFNAIDAMPQGGTLTIATRAVDAPSQLPSSVTSKRVRLDVSDTGTGMSDEVRRRCLEPFFTTKGERGTGLGLAMVYGMAQRHRAEIDIKSKLGEGTTFRLEFAAAPPSTARQETRATDTKQTALRILIIDDDPFILESMRIVLELEGHAVTEANGGQAGIDAFRQALAGGPKFDIVITDLGMPYVNGNQVIEAVKEMSAATPVVLMTGWGRRLGAQSEGATRADYVLSKPPDLDDLREVFAKCVAD